MLPGWCKNENASEMTSVTPMLSWRAPQASRNQQPAMLTRTRYSIKPDHLDKAAIDANIKTGDACVANVQKLIATRTAEIAAIKKLC